MMPTIDLSTHFLDAAGLSSAICSCYFRRFIHAAAISFAYERYAGRPIRFRVFMLRTSAKASSNLLISFLLSLIILFLR